MNDFTIHTDAELIAKLKTNTGFDSKIFDIIYNRYAAKLNVFCAYKSKNIHESEELFEETWLKFIAAIKQGKQLDSILPFLYAIARNLAIDKYRNQKSSKNIRIEYHDIQDIDELMNPFNLQEKIENDEIIGIIKGVLATIDDAYSETFIMQWFGGMSQSQIAQELGIGLSAVKMRNHRVMKEIMKYVKPLFSNAD